MTENEALAYIHSRYWLGSKPGLSRTEELLSEMGNPQNDLSFVHVAGTNGKGSFCAMLASVLQAAGYKVGLYTSPYILRFHERMRINGEPISGRDLAEIITRIRPLAESMKDKPTEFELITAAAMAYFAKEKCDIVVLECGMGGRLDSTNVIRTARLSVITGVSLDHTAFLGDTVREIAAEKAGILKENVPCLFCGDDPAAADVIRRRAQSSGAPFYTVQRDTLTVKNADLDGTRFDAAGYTDLLIPLLGSYQPQNALNVLTAVSILKDGGMRIPETAVRKGLRTVRWRARYEKIAADPVILFDGGHNAEGVKAAVNSTKTYFPNQKLILLTGVMADKKYKEIARELIPITAKAFCVRPDNPRALSAAEWANTFTGYDLPAVACSSVSEALSRAIAAANEQEKPILCIGSLYLYKEIADERKSTPLSSPKSTNY